MTESIKLVDVYDTNLNFLIGSGASAGLFPTLALKVKDEFDDACTLEELATRFAQPDEQARHDLLFLHYYATCIKPVQEYKPGEFDSAVQKKVLENYETFLRTILHVLRRRRPLDKRCNVFTTNYDGCFAFAAENILKEGSDEFVLNDGARGFHRRYLQAENFNSYLCKTGVFERSQTTVPQVNLVHLHGSIYWKKEQGGILVDYLSEPPASLIQPPTLEVAVRNFTNDLLDESKTVDDLRAIPLAPPVRDAFWTAYNKLPIVNPTKWKFWETVFEEHYYQMLRLLSYELEKPNALLITFGFSFADEHILNLVKRSLSNPYLQVYVCCFSQREKHKLEGVFKAYSNVSCIALQEGNLDFQAFNDKVFTTAGLVREDRAPGVISPPEIDEATVAAGAAVIKSAVDNA